MTKEKAALPGGKTAYLARLCIAIDLISDAVSVKRGCLPKNSELKDEGRSDLAMASLGPYVQVCGVDSPGHLSGGDVGCRLTWRTAQCLPKDRASRLGGNCWSRGQKVSLLLSFAQVECRLSSAPPISMTTLSTQIAVLPTRCLAHCLQAGIH